jgi:hypothetical protein
VEQAQQNEKTCLHLPALRWAGFNVESLGRMVPAALQTLLHPRVDPELRGHLHYCQIENRPVNLQAGLVLLIIGGTFRVILASIPLKTTHRLQRIS